MNFKARKCENFEKQFVSWNAGPVHEWRWTQGGTGIYRAGGADGRGDGLFEDGDVLRERDGVEAQRWTKYAPNRRATPPARTRTRR